MLDGRRIAFLGCSLIAAACADDNAGTGGGGGSSSDGGADQGGADDGGADTTGGSGGEGGAVDKAALCDDTFGDALTSAFGRLDGTVLAVVKPSDTQCALVNDDHVVIEVTMQGATYRVVVNIVSDFGDPDVRFLAIDHALVGPAFEEGWHTGGVIGYPEAFGVHSGPPFEPIEMFELADRIADEITIGQKISVFSSSSGGASSHKVHRNEGLTDGAIFLDADGPSPRVLLFHFADQDF